MQEQFKVTVDFPSSQKPDFNELENLRAGLVEHIYASTPAIIKIFFYFEYFSKLLNLNDQNISEAFLIEFIEDYITSIKGTDFHGTDPEFLNSLTEQLKDLSLSETFIQYRNDVISALSKVELQITNIKSILNGIYPESIKSNKVFFPLTDKHPPTGFYGILETITVRINRANNENKFIIIPSEKVIEDKILNQVKISWDMALKLVNKYIRKPYQYHEIIVNFDKREGVYEGNSLGIALTISFIEQLLQFYNTAYYIETVGNCAFTGGVKINGEILPIGEEIISQKLKAVFYSEITTFVFPKDEEIKIKKFYTELRKVYPDREMNLVPVENIEDILNRRDIIEIKKRNLVIRSGRFIGKNWWSAVAVILLSIILSYLFVIDWDDNPYSITSDGSLIYIKNKNGKLLWSENRSIHKGYLILPNFIKKYAMIIDIDGDLNNEVLVINSQDNLLKCYSYDNKILWSYRFRDSVYSLREVMNNDYGISIIDTLTFQGTKSIFLFSSNGPSFASAIYRINALNGERLPGTLWTSGHIEQCLIRDVDGDSLPEITGIAFDNGFEDIVLFSYTIDTLTNVRPSTKEYTINNFPECSFIAYLRFQKCDYDLINEVRTPGYLQGSFIYNEFENIFSFATSLPDDNNQGQIGYRVDINSNKTEIVIDSDFRIRRDSLVAKGILKPPFTDTEEYKQVIKNNILYWRDGKWLKREEF